MLSELLLMYKFCILRIHKAYESLVYNNNNNNNNNKQIKG